MIAIGSRRVEIIIKGRMNGSLGRMRSTGSTRDSKCGGNIIMGKRKRRRLIVIVIGRERGGIIPVNVSFLRPPPMGTSNSNFHEGPLNSTSRFSYRIGADRAEETAVDAARARTVRFM